MDLDKCDLSNNNGLLTCVYFSNITIGIDESLQTTEVAEVDEDTDDVEEYDLCD